MTAQRFTWAALCAMCSAALFTGCATKQEPLRVAVPVPCRVAMPARPQMPTEALAPDVSLDDFVAAAAAEIERREGYEVQLRAALAACAGSSSASAGVETADAEGAR